jgi:TPR repeat protein
VDEFETFRRFWCCGVASCIACSDSHRKASQAAQEAQDKMARRGNRRNMADCKERLVEMEILLRCPFCRADEPTSEAECYEMTLAHAKAGKAWTRVQVGVRLVQGHGVTQDVAAAIDWWTSAAELDAWPALASC